MHFNLSLYVVIRIFSYAFINVLSDIHTVISVNYIKWGDTRAFHALLRQTHALRTVAAPSFLLPQIWLLEKASLKGLLLTVSMTSNFGMDLKFLNPASLDASSGITAPVRHSDYYFEDGNLVIQVSLTPSSLRIIGIQLIRSKIHCLMSFGQHSLVIHEFSGTYCLYPHPKVPLTRQSRERRTFSLCDSLEYPASILSVCCGYYIHSKCT